MPHTVSRGVESKVKINGQRFTRDSNSEQCGRLPRQNARTERPDAYDGGPH